MMLMNATRTPSAHGKELERIRQRLGMNDSTFATKLGLKPKTYGNYKSGVSQTVKEEVLAKARALEGQQSGEFSIPLAVQPERVPYLGLISSGMKVSWTDPMSAVDGFEPVPMGFEGPKRFSARVEGDCMMPLLHPDDLVVFERSSVQKVNAVVMWRADDGSLTIKTLRHNGSEFQLVPLNPSYETTKAVGQQMGFLVGIIHHEGSRTTMDIDVSGIRPKNV